MNETQRQLMIDTVKFYKARKLFWDDVQKYGGIPQALRALDCETTDEAISMLAEVQKVSLSKINGKVTAQ